MGCNKGPSLCCSKRKKTPHPALAVQRRSKHKEDTLAARPIMLKEPKLEDKPEPLSIYRPTVENLSTPIGTPIEGLFEESEEILEDPEDEPVLGRRISESEEEERAPPEAEFMEIFEGLGIAADSVLFLPLSFPHPHYRWLWSTSYGAFSV
nr:hypothetical protein CFP56_04944 [Quercus suber]